MAIVLTTIESIGTIAVTNAYQNATVNTTIEKPTRRSSRCSPVAAVAAVATATLVTEAVEKEKVLLFTP